MFVSFSTLLLSASLFRTLHLSQLGIHCPLVAVMFSCDFLSYSRMFDCIRLIHYDLSWSLFFPVLFLSDILVDFRLSRGFMFSYDFNVVPMVLLGRLLIPQVSWCVFIVFWGLPMFVNTIGLEASNVTQMFICPGWAAALTTNTLFVVCMLCCGTS